MSTIRTFTLKKIYIYIWIFFSITWFYLFRTVLFGKVQRKALWQEENILIIGYGITKSMNYVNTVQKINFNNKLEKL